MGTAQSVPLWVNEIEIMLQTGWTERQLLEEVSLGTIVRMQVYLSLKEKARKLREKM